MRRPFQLWQIALVIALRCALPQADERSAEPIDLDQQQLRQFAAPKYCSRPIRRGASCCAPIGVEEADLAVLTI